MENKDIVSKLIEQLIISKDADKQLLIQMSNLLKLQDTPKKKKGKSVSENQLSLPIIQDQNKPEEVKQETSNGFYHVGDRLVFKANKNLVSKVIKVTKEDIEVLCLDTNKTKVLKQSYSKRYYMKENELGIYSGQKWKGYAREVKDKIIEIDSVHYIDNKVDYIIPKNSKHHAHNTLNKKIKLRSLITRYKEV